MKEVSEVQNLSYDKDSFKQLIFGNLSLYWLATVPLFLKMLCLLNSEGINPTNKVELYNTTLYILLEYWDRSKDFKSGMAIAEVRPDQVKNILKSLSKHFAAGSQSVPVSWSVQQFAYPSRLVSPLL